jgi:hypothetical protein
LLEDEEYHIRRKTAQEISRILKVGPYNETVVMRELMSLFLSGFSYVESLKKANRFGSTDQLLLKHQCSIARIPV